MADVFELAVTVLSVTIYRRWILRTALRVFSLSGAWLCIVTGAFLGRWPDAPLAVDCAWGLSFLILLLAEYEVGNRRIAYLGWGSAVLLAGIAVQTGL